MPEYEAWPTRYNGHEFRSRTEATWAVFFDALGLKWSFEPEPFLLDHNGGYLPDFFLPLQKGFGFNLAGISLHSWSCYEDVVDGTDDSISDGNGDAIGVYIEVKGRPPTALEQQKALEAATQSSRPFVIFSGYPALNLVGRGYDPSGQSNGGSYRFLQCPFCGMLTISARDPQRCECLASKVLPYIDIDFPMTARTKSLSAAVDVANSKKFEFEARDEVVTAAEGKPKIMNLELGFIDDRSRENIEFSSRDWLTTWDISAMSDVRFERWKALPLEQTVVHDARNTDLFGKPLPYRPVVAVRNRDSTYRMQIEPAEAEVLRRAIAVQSANLEKLWEWRVWRYHYRTHGIGDD